jgi:hypothetical protein
MNAPLPTALAERADHILDEGGTAPLSLTPIDSQQVVAIPSPMPANQPVSPDALIQFAMAKGANLDYIQRLLDLRDRWKEEQRREAFFAAMAGFNTEDLLIIKNQHVEFKTRDGDTTSYDHADLWDIINVVKPALAKHGLSLRWKERVEGRTVWCTAYVRHALGYEEASEPLPGPFDDTGKKNNHQQMASAISYLRRYTAFGILGMAAKGHDDDGRKAGVAGGADPAAQSTPSEQNDSAPGIVDSFNACKTIPELSRVMNGLSMAQKKQFQAAFNTRRDELKRGAQ